MPARMRTVTIQSDKTSKELNDLLITGRYQLVEIQGFGDWGVASLIDWRLQLEDYDAHKLRMSTNAPNHRVAASDLDLEIRRGPQLRCI